MPPLVTLLDKTDHKATTPKIINIFSKKVIISIIEIKLIILLKPIILTHNNIIMVRERVLIKMISVRHIKVEQPMVNGKK